MRIFYVALVVSFTYSCYAGGGNSDTFNGLYMNYDGAEYENAFVKCGSDEIWLIKKNNAYLELAKLYESSSLSQYGELLIEISGEFVAIDKKKYPKSHYVGEFSISEIVSYTSNPALIDKCRGQ